MKNKKIIGIAIFLLVISMLGFMSAHILSNIMSGVLNIKLVFFGNDITLIKNLFIDLILLLSFGCQFIVIIFLLYILCMNNKD